MKMFGLRIYIKNFTVVKVACFQNNQVDSSLRGCL